MTRSRKRSVGASRNSPRAISSLMMSNRESYVERCDCGEPLHYTDPETKRDVENLISRLGSHVRVEVPGLGAWYVPRHYIALHGLRGGDLPRLGTLYRWHRE